MFKNYFKTALRNLKRNKSYAMINVLGLAVGIAASLLIFLIIQFETSFDNFHKKKNSIYRVLTQATAEKYFGDWKTAMGKTIKYENKTLYKITGILKNPPPNTDFPLSVVASYSALQNTYIKDNLNDWVSTFGGAYTFVVLPLEFSPSKFNAQLIGFAKKHKPAEYSKD